MAAYVALTLDLPLEWCDRAAHLLHERQALGVEIRDHEHPPPPGVPAPAPGRALVIGYFPESAAATVLARLLDDLGPTLDPTQVALTVARCQDEDWAESWKAHFAPIHVGGRLWVLPPWVPAPVGEPAVIIEPGMAFGTGAHATTLLCLEALVRLLPERPGARVLDLGCGTGILGIAAERLGAAEVWMVDNDPAAAEIARQNAAENRCTRVRADDTPLDQIGGAFEVIVANILAVTLIDLAGSITRRLSRPGDLLLSGILGTQADEVRSAYEALGLLSHATLDAGEWSLLHLII